MILSPLCGSLPLCLCVKILLSQSSRDAKTQSLPHAVRHLILSHLCASVPLCLCVNFITETQRHRVFFILLCLSAPLSLCVIIFYRRVEIHFLILSILLILSKKWDSRLSLRSACSLPYGSRTPTRGGYLPLCLCVKRRIKKISNVKL